MAEFRGPIKAWSFSRWSVYEQCPAQANYKFVMKVPVKEEEKGEALIRGEQIHKEAEDFATGKLRALPVNLRLLKPEFTELKKLKAPPELELAFTQSWAPTDWFSKTAWVRVKLDSIVRATKKLPACRPIDFKTGKLRENAGYEEQLELYSIAALITDPIAEEARPELWFTDHGKIVRPLHPKTKEVIVHRRKDLESLKAKWEERVTPMLNDTKFVPKQNFGCRWCQYSKAKGGPCKF